LVLIPGDQSSNWNKYGERCAMPLRYKVSPELNMVLYIGDGFLKPSHFFDLEKTIFLEYPRPPGIITLVDLLDASTYFELDDIHHFIDHIKGMTKGGLEPGPYFMLTNDRGLHLLVHAADLMAGKFDLKAGTYHTLHDAITALGLSDREQEVIQLWNACKLDSSRIAPDLTDAKTPEQTTQDSVHTWDVE
jgi:hypothetical protein